MNPVEVVLQEPINGSAVEENHSVRNSSNVDVQGVLESDMELEKQKEDEAKFIKLQESVKFLEDERNSWLQKQHFEGQTTIEQIGVDAMVEKRMDENSEFAVKVSETYPEGHHDEVAGHISHSAVNQDRMLNGNLTTRAHILEYPDGMFELAEKASSSVGIMNDENVTDDFVSENIVFSRTSLQSGDLRIGDEIVTVPLDEVQIHEDDSLKAQNDDKSESSSVGCSAYWGTFPLDLF